MKRLITVLTLAVATIVLAAPVQAAHFWKIQMSDPTTSDQVRTFNIEYTALSTEPTDQIAVKLFQNGTEIDAQTTAPGGDSGVFTVTVPADGSYTYKLSGQSSDDASTLETSEKVVSVATPETGTTVITVTDTGAGGAAGGAATAGGVATTGTATGGGEVAGAEDEAPEDGQVGENGATTEEDGDVLGAEDQATDNTPWGWIILAGLALLAAAYYLLYHRQGKTLFNRKES